MTAFTELVGCTAPIQQAPMGSVSTPDLAVAVADAGGVGSITALGLPADRLDAVVSGMAARTSGVLAVNFLTNQLDRDALAAAASRVRLIDFFWVDPAPALVEIAHRGGALVCWQVGSLEEARAAADAGADVVAVQGIEAGGHVRGDTPLLQLLDDVLGQIDVPVVAAGGIGDERTYADVIARGASGARVGTRFVASVESGAHPRYKQAVVDASGTETTISDAFSVCPLCATSPRARVLSSCVEAVHALDTNTVGDVVLGTERVTLPKGHGLPPSATTTGHIDAMAMYAGESTTDITAIESAGDIVRAWSSAVSGRL